MVPMDPIVIILRVGEVIAYWLIAAGVWALFFKRNKE